MEKQNSMQLFKLKKLIRRLQAAKIDGSAITLAIKPEKSITETIKTLK